MTKRPRARSTRIAVVASLAAIGALVGAVLIPISAQATSVALSGTVSTTSDAKLSGVPVTVYDFPGEVLGALVASTTSSATGTFAVAALPPGEYTLRFGASKLTYPQFLGETADVAEAESITLTTGGGNHDFVGAVLAGSGSIGGSVKTTTGAGIGGYTVRAYPDGGDESNPVQSATTSSSGAYTLAGLQPGTYRLEALSTAASPAYAPTYSGGSATIETANALGVVAAKTTAYSFSLSKAGSVSGKVIGQTATGFENLSGVTVTPYLLLGTAPSFYDSTSEGARSTVTNASGAYTLKGLAPGYYTVDFDPGHLAIGASHSIYGRTFLGGYELATSSTVVHVVSGGAIAGQNATLEPAGSVHINFEDGPAWVNTNTEVDLANIRVTVDHAGTDPLHPSKDAQTGITDANGNITFTGLGGGNWEWIGGSNVDSDPTDGITEDTSYKRQYGGFTVGAGSLDYESFLLYPKPAGGLQATVAPVISNSGSVSVGSNIYVNTGTWNDTVDTYSYQWYRNGVAIAGATLTNYQLQGGDYGATVTARVTATSFNNGVGTADTASAGTVVQGNLANFGYLPGVLGTFRVGETIALDDTSWELGGLVYTYQWQNSSNGTTWNDISGATSQAYQLTSADQVAGKIRLHFTIAREGYTTIDTTSPAQTVFTNVFTATTAPRVVVTASSFAVVDGTWSPNLGTTTDYWTIHNPNGSVTQTTGASISRAGTAGDWVSVIVDRTAPGVDENQTYQPTAQVGTVAVTSLAAVTGAAQVGVTLNASAPVFAPTGLSLAARWQQRVGTKWKDISGASGATYQLKSTDLGHAVRVAYSGTKPGYAPITSYSNPTAVVTQGSAPVASVLPSTTGTPGTNASVIASPGTWSPTPTSFTYQWEYSANGLAPYTKIAGAKLYSYTVPASLLGKYLFVQVTPVLGGHAITPAVAEAGQVSTLNLLPIANVKVTHVGTDYAASGARFSPTPTNITYNWYSYDANDSTFSLQATGPTYDPPSPYTARHLFVTVTGQLLGYSNTTQAPVLAQKGTIQKISGTPTITGTKVGSTLTPTTIAYSPANGFTFTDAWQYLSGSTWKAIPGASGSTWSPTAAYVGKQVRFSETATHPDYTSLVTTTTPVTITLGDAPTAVASSATITGDNSIGGTLHANPGTWNGPSGLTFSYQWLQSIDNASWSTIAGATGTTYVIPESAYGVDYIGLQITASKSGYISNNTVVDAAGLPATGELVASTAPKVTKSAAGQYTVTSGTWKPAATGYSYEWLSYDPATDTSTVQASGSTYTPSNALDGLRITARVTASRNAAWDDAQYSVVARAGATITPTGALSVQGAAISSYTLTATYTTWSVPSPTVGVQWYRGTKAIPGATGNTYALTDADVGFSISARITVSKLGFPTSVYTAGSVVPVYYTDLATTVGPIVGTGNADDPLSIAPFTLPVAGTTLTYQWFDNYNDIPGATGATYTPSPAQIGDEISVEVHFSKAHYGNDQETVSPITVQAGTALSYISLVPVGVSGTPQIGKTLTAVVGSWNYTPELRYQWESSADGTSWAVISGASSNTYVPTAADGLAPGSLVRVHVIAIRAGHASAAIASGGVTLQP